MSVFTDLQKSKHPKAVSSVLSAALMGKGCIFINQSLVEGRRKAWEC